MPAELLEEALLWKKKRNHIQRRETFQMNMVLIALLIHGAASSAFDAPSLM